MVMLWAGMWVPLLHISLNRRLHAALRMGREQPKILPRSLRLSIRRAQLHSGAKGDEAAQRGRRSRRNDKRDGPRDGRAGGQPPR